MKTVKCWRCLKVIEIKNDTYYHGINRNPGDPQFYCNDCYKVIKSERMKKYSWNSLSDKEKEIRNKKIKDTWDNKSDEEKTEISSKQSQRMKERYENMSEEEKEKHREFVRNIYNNLPDEKKNEISIKAKERYENMSSDQLHQIGENVRNWYNSLSEEEKVNYANEKRKWYDDLKEKEKDEWKQRSIDMWDQMSIQKKKNILRKRLKKVGNKNSLNIKFENYFNNSIISNDFYYKSEFIVNNNGNTKSWNYAIYDSNNQLIMLVDLDGEYFHADTSDYNGIHSHEDYDERRYQMVPEGVKLSIIYENSFKKSFENMIKCLMESYDDFIHHQFNLCRSMPFPYPHYTDHELIKSWNQLIKLKCDSTKISINNREGDRIIHHFHRSIYNANTKGNISPYNAWYNDELLMKVIKNRIIYVNTLNPNKILQGFNVSKIAPKVSVFSAGRAKLLINRYLSDYNEIFDPFSGFSGRMLGAISLGKKYIGQDISPIHVRESNEIIKFLDIDASVIQCDILQSSGEYQCLFTCSPYSNKEQWQDVKPDTRSCDDWIDECLKRFKCRKYLFVVDYTDKYKEYIVDEIRNKSHFGINSEYVIMIQR